MAEVKNAFIKSKMNKDLDSRLLPSGEYRDGQNIQVSKSEGEDVGALENAVGNIPATTQNENVDFSVLSGCGCNLKSIGIYADTNSSNIYVFLTDFTAETEAINSEYKTTSNNFIYSYNTLTRAVVKLVEGPFLNFSQNNPIYGINVLENLLFWTDNRNQPRKINISTATENPSHYNSEDNISVAKYNPYQVIDLYYEDTVNQPSDVYVSSLQDVTSTKLPNKTTDNPYYNPTWPGDPDYLEDKFVTFSYRFKFNDGEQSIMAPFTQEAFIPKQDGYFLEGNEDDAYRSTIVRFMENKVNSVGLYIPLPFSKNTIGSALDVSEIEILYKESDSLTVKVLDSVPVNLKFGQTSNGDPDQSTVYLYDYQSRKPYKTLPESEIIRVYDKVPVRAFGQEVIGNRIVYSNFQDKHTPPATIDYDIGVTAKETFNVTNANKSTWATSIREYPMHTVKQNRNYQVGFVLSDRYGRQSTVILSPVTDTQQTDTSTNITFGGSTFYHPYKTTPGAGQNDINSWSGDSIKVLVNNIIPESLVGVEGYPGLYQPYYITVNGNQELNPKYNPLGWYSYKIVVKQTEQEYYNVYLPGILDGYPDVAQAVPTANPDPVPDPQGTIAHITLIGDNINKVPRNLTEVGPEQKQYGSEVQLFGRVSPNRNATPTFTEPYYPQTNSQTVVTISEQNNLFDNSATPPPNFATVYQTETNPYVARTSQNNVSSVVGTTLPSPIGSLQATSVATDYKILLGVFETAPVESLLDIFWETSTSGLISDLNDIAGSQTSISGWVEFNFSQTEGTNQGASITQTKVNNIITSDTFAPGVPSAFGDVPMLDSIVELTGITHNGPTPNDISSDYGSLIEVPANTGSYSRSWKSYKIEVKNPKYFEINGALNEFTFSFNVTNLDVPVADQVAFPSSITVTLGNENPIIDTITQPIQVSNDRNLTASIASFTGENGSVNSNDKYKDLIWSIRDGSQVPSLPSMTLSSSGVLKQENDASGNYSFDLVLRDTDGGSGFKEDVENVSVVFGQTQINPNFGSTASSKALSTGLQSSGLYWGSNYSEPSLIETTLVDSPGFTSTGSDDNSRNAYNDPGTTSNPVIGGTDFTLNNTGLSNTNRDWRQWTSTNITNNNGDQYNWRNENFKPSYFTQDGVIADDINSSLTKGTAYIKVDFRFKGWPSYTQQNNEFAGAEEFPQPTDQLGVSWLAYLQYRPDQTATWITAQDVEGQDIKFGCVQENQLGLSGVNVASSNNFQSQGLLTNSSTSIGISETSGSATQDNIVVSSAPWVGSTNQIQLPGATSSKVFAFGKDQGYENVNNDKFGEYRLLVKYPESIPSGQAPFSKMVPAPGTGNGGGPNGMPEWVLQPAGPVKTDVNIGVSISFGDFYYKNPIISSSFGYLISTTGQASNTAAATKTPAVPVFAREWSMKYVTQFYEDAELSIKYTGTINENWYSYSATTTNTVNANEGSDNSSVGGINSIAPSPSTINQTLTLANRRWVAKFDGDGKKIVQTAEPSTSTF